MAHLSVHFGTNLDKISEDASRSNCSASTEEPEQTGGSCNVAPAKPVVGQASSMTKWESLKRANRTASTGAGRVGGRLARRLCRTLPDSRKLPVSAHAPQPDTAGERASSQTRSRFTGEFLCPSMARNGARRKVDSRRYRDEVQRCRSGGKRVRRLYPALRTHQMPGLSGSGHSLHSPPMIPSHLHPSRLAPPPIPPKPRRQAIAVPLTPGPCFCGERKPGGTPQSCHWRNAVISTGEQQLGSTLSSLPAMCHFRLSPSKRLAADLPFVMRARRLGLVLSPPRSLCFLGS